MQGWKLRELRRKRGLTLRQVARAAGTAESNVAAYERGAKLPNRRTLDRLIAVVKVGAGSAIHSMNLLTVPATAAALRIGLRDGWTTAELLRLVREMISNAQFVESAAERAAFFAEPSTTGDPRWDALLAGAVEDMAMRSDLSVPDWTRGKALPEFWFVSDRPALRAYAFAHSPFSLQVRGVMIDPTDLESV